MRRTWLVTMLALAIVAGSAGAAAAQDRTAPGVPGPLRLVIAVDDAPGGSRGQPTATRRFKAGRTVYVNFMVSGQGTDKDGRVRVQIDCRILGPDGAPRIDRPGAAEARGPCQPTGFCMADHAIDFATEPGDLAGTYRIEATARDLISGQRASARQAFELTAAEGGETGSAPAPGCFSSVQDMDRWMMSYYRTPDPAKLSCALPYFAASPAGGRVDTLLPFAHFYAALIGGNAEALSRLFDQVAPQADPRARVVALHVFRFSGSARGSELLSRGCKDWSTLEVDRVCAAMGGTPQTPLLQEPLVSPDVLDSLWARFAATGDTAFVRRIASIAHMKEDGHGRDIVMGGAACWSLTSMAREHPKVRETLEELLSREQGTQKAALEKILQDSRQPAE